MTAAERTALRTAVDAAVRARVAAENAGMRLCAGCGLPLADYTPGCKSCWNRHRNWRTGRNRRPYPPDPVFDAHVRMLCADWQHYQTSQNGAESLARLGRRTGGTNGGGGWRGHRGVFSQGAAA